MTYNLISKMISFSISNSISNYKTLCSLGLDRTYEYSIVNYPTLADPFESKYVYVDISRIPEAGQGLFSRVDVEPDTILCYFNGIRTPNGTCSDYSIFLNDETMLDIPFEWISVESYRATLGHKICHSFSPNAAYSFAYHPRFGNIRCVKSIKSIRKNEEILCDYKYSVKKSPAWYKESLRRYLVHDLGLENQDISSWIEKQSVIKTGRT